MAPTPYFLNKCLSDFQKPSFPYFQTHSPTPLSSTPGFATQRSACSILPSRVTAGLAGLMLATARLVLACKVSRAAPICFAKARASGLSPLPLKQQSEIERKSLMTCKIIRASNRKGNKVLSYPKSSPPLKRKKKVFGGLFC